MSEQIIEKTCTRCGETKPADFEHFPWREKKSNWDPWCRECYRKKTNLYNAKNPRGKSPNQKAIEEAARQIRITQCDESKQRVLEAKRLARLTAKERQKEHARKYNARVKREVFEHYGGVICQCCGETEILMLALDHIAGDGAAHRRALSGDSRKNIGTAHLWARANDYPPIFRVLCMNCNWARHWNGGICPHEAKRLALVS